MSVAEDGPVAVIGLGRIGTGIAHSLLRRGFRVRVYNRTVARAAPLVSAGATLAPTSAQAATRACPSRVSSLLDDASVRAVVEAEQGLMAGMSAGGIHVSTTTCSPGLAEKWLRVHRSAGLHYLAAPVVGRPNAALAGELLSLVGGPTEVLERARSCIEAYSARIVHVGVTPGAANSLKLAFNFYLASTIELFAEFLAFTDKSGIGSPTAMQVLREFQGHPGIGAYLERIGVRDFDTAGFEMATGLKDLQLILDASAAVRSPLPYAAVVRDRAS